MVTNFLKPLVKLDLNDSLYKESFYTAGELLDIYLLKEEKVVYSVIIS